MTDDSEIFPHDIEVEQAILGAILIDNGALASLSGLAPGHFYEPLHQGLFDWIQTLVASGKAADAASLRAYTDGCAPVTDDLTATQYLGRLAVRAPRNPPLKSLAERLIDLAKRRALAGLIMDIRQDIACGVDTAEILTKSEATICQVSESGGMRETLVTMKSAVDIAIESMADAYANPEQLRGVRTGLVDLDAKLGGLMNSDLIVLAGRPSMGKTALAGTICMAAAKQFMAEQSDRPRRVAFYSLEMKADQIAGRLIADRAEVSSEKLRRGMVTQYEIDKAITAAREIDGMPIIFDQMGGASMAHVAMRSRRLHMRQPLGLIIVDYLQLMQASKTHGNRVGEITEITTGLKALAKELDVPVLALSQLSRQVEQRQDKRPQLSDLRESGSIEQDSDVVMFVYRDDYYLSREQPSDEDEVKFAEWQQKMRRASGRAEIILAKQRHGSTGIVTCSFQSHLTRFADLETRHAA